MSGRCITFQAQAPGNGRTNHSHAGKCGGWVVGGQENVFEDGLYLWVVSLVTSAGLSEDRDDVLVLRVRIRSIQELGRSAPSPFKTLVASSLIGSTYYPNNLLGWG